MEIREAYERAMQIPEVKKLVSEGFYLSSALLNQTHLDSADKWILAFFNPDTGKVFSVTVTESDVQVSTVQDPLREGYYRKMSLEGRDNIAQILGIVAREYSGTPAQVLISAKPDKWEALVVGNNLKTLYLEIDVKTRKVVKKERGSLLG